MQEYSSKQYVLKTTLQQSMEESFFLSLKHLE